MQLHFMLIFVYSLATTINAKRDCLKVKGNFQCNTEVPMFMQLVDYDLLKKDDVMAEMCPVNIAKGSFKLDGCASDLIGKIDPELHIYHKCKGNKISKIVLIIPKTALGGEYNFTKMLDLNGPFDKESTVSKFPDPDGCNTGGGFKKLIKKFLAFIGFFSMLAG